jgi:predicted nucleic acid-binding protein
VIGEFLAVNRRKHFVSHADAIEIAAILGRAFDLVELDTALRIKAADLSETARINFYDALIIVAAAKGGATHILSEDMADGQQLAGVRVVNPFDRRNAAEVAGLLE